MLDKTPCKQRAMELDSDTPTYAHAWHILLELGSFGIVKGMFPSGHAMHASSVHTMRCYWPGHNKQQWWATVVNIPI